MDTVLLVSAIVLGSLVLVVLLWIFRPAILSRHNASKPKLKNKFCDSKGEIDTDNQIHEHAKCDISLVVPAYNEVTQSQQVEYCTHHQIVNICICNTYATGVTLSANVG
mmetsp:Transcript_6775/g.11167  ORF Transcript_6775/g.11167 Transcript_6775/m.11167 type:complete len:109 (-) Transcript_6775:1593-1919(-)